MKPLLGDCTDEAVCSATVQAPPRQRQHHFMDGETTRARLLLRSCVSKDSKPHWVYRKGS